MSVKYLPFECSNTVASQQERECGWKNLVITTGVEEIPADNRISVDVTNSNILISGADLNMRAAVYNLSGSLVYESIEKTIPMPASGIYIVHIADKSFKVAVK